MSALRCIVSSTAAIAGGMRPPPPPGGGPRPLFGPGHGAVHGVPVHGQAVAVPAPRRKMRSLFWDKLAPVRIPGSLWEGFAAADWLDFEAIEEQFQQVGLDS